MNKTILITGANRGIGLALAKQYQDDGWQVLATCREPEKADGLKSLRLEPFALDVTDPKSCSQLAQELVGQSIDVLFNNAGIFGPRGLKLGELEPESWLEVLKVNSVAPALVTQAFLEHVASSQDKLMVYTSSSMASIAAGSSGEYIYRSSKAALNMFVARAAQELDSKGIRTVAMDPGWVRTDMGGSSAALSPEESARGMKNVLDTLGHQSGVYLRHDGATLPW